jgi:nucleoside-diphosphate-sugar epimerase
MSINKIKKITGWKPKVSLKQGIEKLIENEVGK